MKLDSYIDAGTLASVEFANKLTPGYANGKPVAEIDVLQAVREVVAIDPPSVAAVSENDADGFVALAERLRAIFVDIDRGDIDDAAELLNNILLEHPATPYLAKEEGVWHLHHHPANAAVLPMWTAICAEGLARMIGTQNAHRLGICMADNCDRVFADTSKNATRRFCSSACQNRTKTAAFRARKRDAEANESKS
ncbi:CGNR zinc finger domain-containing protein [Cognatiyoonia sp. IB215182]|uniref:CGNR zinc finger domain-containing protein n=1 Tax=Cognatiyoonia sp. IB215182 TaxID=3097353 RepID=UPI002A175F27|nr:CGNR zinc finger domain-containing protein [Cognatiyoonia sp. IB215182]MDX8355584.1 CGNR zinc finger domain-containing protein [Cognatiyoonia sp. IB215182]